VFYYYAAKQNGWVSSSASSGVAGSPFVKVQNENREEIIVRLGPLNEDTPCY
jgi:hypothetical protein